MRCGISTQREPKRGTQRRMAAWEWVQLYKPDMVALGFIPVVTRNVTRRHWAYPDEPLQALCNFDNEVWPIATISPEIREAHDFSRLPMCRACAHSNRIRDRWEELACDTEGAVA